MEAKIEDARERIKEAVHDFQDNARSTNLQQCVDVLKQRMIEFMEGTPTTGLEWLSDEAVENYLRQAQEDYQVGFSEALELLNTNYYRGIVSAKNRLVCFVEDVASGTVELDRRLRKKANALA